MIRRVHIFWSIFVAAALFRVWQSFWVEPPSIGQCLKEIVSGKGTVTDEPSFTQTGQVIVVSVEELQIASTTYHCASDFLIRMKTKLYPRFTFDDHVLFKGKLLEPANFGSGSDRTFDYRGYLAKDDIYYEMKSAIVKGTSGKVQGESDTKTLHFIQSVPDIISSWLYALKRAFVRNLEMTLGEPHAALAAGLVVGEKAALGKDLLNDFRIVGLIHIVVLSGFNITVVGDAMRRLLSFLPRVWGIVLGGIGIVLFGVLVGGGATVVRSCFMAGIALSADLIRRDYDVTRALLFAALIMLIQNPMILLHDPSFQLSFLATLGLILLASPIEKRLTFIPEMFGMRGIVASTFATQIFVSPYILYMMGQLSIIGVVVNILVLPFIPITMLAVFLTGMVGLLSLPVAEVFGWGAHLLLSYELFMVQNFARLPFAAVHFPEFSLWWVVLFYLVFLGVYWGRKGTINKNSSSISHAEYLFKEFQNMTKGQLIDLPSEIVSTDYIVADILLKRLGSNRLKVMFTRRTLKHLAEKGPEGKRLFILIPAILHDPELILSGRKSRILMVKSINREKEGSYFVVVAEINKDNMIIITSFVAHEKYLKNFEILWRTAALS